MKQTYLKLSDDTANKLLKILEDVPPKQRDASWRNLHEEVKRIVDIWSNISIRALHVAKIHAQAKSNTKRPSYSKIKK